MFLKAKSAESHDMHEVSWPLTFGLHLQEIAIHREPHEDSTKNISLALQLHVI